MAMRASLPTFCPAKPLRKKMRSRPSSLVENPTAFENIAFFIGPNYRRILKIVKRCCFEYFFASCALTAVGFSWHLVAGYENREDRVYRFLAKKERRIEAQHAGRCLFLFARVRRQKPCLLGKSCYFFVDPTNRGKTERLD